MAGTLAAVSNISSGIAPVAKPEAQRQGQGDQADQGVQAAAAQAASSQKTAAPTQNAGTQSRDAVKAIDETLKASDARRATEAFLNLQQAQGAQPSARGAPPAEAPVEAQEQAQDQAQDSAPQRAGTGAGQETRQIEQADAAVQARESAERAFIARQALDAHNAQAGPASQLGTTIDTTA